MLKFLPVWLMQLSRWIACSLKLCTELQGLQVVDVLSLHGRSVYEKLVSFEENNSTYIIQSYDISRPISLSGTPMDLNMMI